jgi:NAD(P)-dependent dehydrogenase (short-subunit alcohol dehydrogenase family)
MKFKQESNYEEFKDNLIFYPLDLRIVSSIENFIKYLYDNFPHIDILINNAAIDSKVNNKGNLKKSNKIL